MPSASFVVAAARNMIDGISIIVHIVINIFVVNVYVTFVTLVIIVLNEFWNFVVFWVWNLIIVRDVDVDRGLT